MRRTRLIWFAFGAAASAIVAVLTFAFQSPKPEHSLILRIEEPDFNPTPEQWSAMSPEEQKLSNIAFSAGKLARDCGVSEFETTLPGSTHLNPYVEVVVDKTSARALDCLIAESNDIRARFYFRELEGD